MANTSITTASGIRSQGTVTPSPYSATTKYYNPYAKSNSNSNRNYNNDHSSLTTPHQRRLVNNPYQRKDTQYNFAPSSNNNAYQSSTSSNVNLDSYRSSLAKQHPHRAGRIRVDRQFTTDLSISSVHDYDDEDKNDDNGNDDTIHGQNNDLMLKSQMKLSANVSIDDSLSMKKSVHDNKSDDGEEDDDDGDDLLLFIPFGKGD